MSATFRNRRGKAIALGISGIFAASLVACSAAAGAQSSRHYKLDKGLVTLTNSLNGEKIEIRMTNVVDPAVPGPGAATPDPGDRFVAVQYQIQNVGTLPYDGDTVQMSAVLNDREGQQFKPVFVQPKTSAGPDLGNSVSVMPGQKRLGYVVFELPDTSVPAQAQWSMGMGFGGTGMWDIGGP
jgi:hypothetical protein